MYSVKDSVIRSFVRDNYPNARLVSWDDPDSELEFYTAEQLREVDHDWFPLCCHNDEESHKVVYGGRSRIVHTYTEGETGAGKTSRFAMQAIRALSCLKGKPSFVIVDIHGELAENLYTHLQENGYNIKILNCDDPNRSDTYNPFAPLVKRCMESGKLDNEVIKGVRKIAEIMQPVNSKNDPIWEQGARSYTNGGILDKFEDLLKGDIPPQCITLYNIIENHYWLRERVTHHSGGLMSIDHYQQKGADALSVQKMMAVTNNAEKTKGSYFGVIENHYDVFGQPSLYQISSNSTIDIDQFVDTPTAIFIQSGSTKIGDDFIALLVNEIYTTAVIRGKNTARKTLPRNIHCFLDEFANSNIAEGPEFIKMLTTSRKFGMYWHMLLQCDAQLDTKFDANIARIIRANCTEIFMGSNEYETMVRFAKSCGQKTVEALGSMVAQNTPVLETVDLITADKLSLTEYGHVYVKSNRRPLLHSYMEAFFNCPEFVPVPDIHAIYPVNDFDYETTVFVPDDILPSLTGLEYRLLAYLHLGGGKDIAELKKEFGYRVTDTVEKLLEEELIEEHNEQISSLLSDQQYALLTFRQALFPAEEQDDPESELPEEDQETEEAALEKLENALAQISCLSDYLADALRKKCRGIPFDEDETEQFTSPVLRFELMELFIKNHDYPEKSQWVEQFRKEVEVAKTIRQLPPLAETAFVNALKEITYSLTMDEIKQIKQLITE